MRIARLVLVVSVLSIIALSSELGLFYQGPSTADAAGNQNGYLRLTLVGRPYSLNQITAFSDCKSCWEIIDLENAFGLPTMPNGSLYFQAGLFDWYSVTPNGTIWDFNIRPNAKWSDGVPITSSDINFTFGLSSGYIFGTSSDFLNLGANVKSVSAKNSSLTEIVLNRTEADFGLIMSNQYYFAPVPKHVWGVSQDYNTSDNFAQDVTSGPFYHLSYDGGPTLTLVANPYYWNGPHLEEIIVTFADQSSQSPAALISGATDLAQVDSSSVSQFLGSSSSNFVVKAEPDRAISYLEYNTTMAPFDNLAFRQALAYSINTSTIAQNVYHGYATPGEIAEGSIPPSASLFHDSNTSRYPYNVTKAQSLLTSIGYKISGSELLYQNGSRVSFKIYTDTNQSGDLSLAEFVATSLTSLGMNVSIVQLPLSRLAGDYGNSSVGDIAKQMVVASSNLPVFGLASTDIAPGYDVYYPWFVPESTWLSPASAQARYEQLLSVANSTTDATAVRQTVQNIDLLNSQYLPNIVLAYPDTIWVYRTDQGLSFPNTTIGFDIGGLSLNPVEFSGISCASGSSCLTAPTISSASSSSSGSLSASSVTTSQQSTLAPPGNNTLPIIILIIVIFVIVVIGTIVGRRRQPVAPPPSPIAR